MHLRLQYVGNGVILPSVTIVSGPSTYSLARTPTEARGTHFFRRLTPVVAIEGYPMCRSVLVSASWIYSVFMDFFSHLQIYFAGLIWCLLF